MACKDRSVAYRLASGVVRMRGLRAGALRRALVLVVFHLLTPTPMAVHAQDSCDTEREVLAKLVVRLTSARSQAELDLARTETALRRALAEVERLRAERKER